MLLAFLFWHSHHGTQAPLDRLVAPLAAIPVPIWAAIIGVFAAIVTPILNHYLTAARERAASERTGRRETRPER